MHTLTLTFPSLAELQAAVAKLTGSGKTNASAATTASTERTASAGAAVAQETKAEPSASNEDPFGDAGGSAEEVKPLDFKADVINALRDYSKKPGVDQAKFGALLKKFGVTKVPELEAKGESVWRDVLKAIAA